MQESLFSINKFQEPKVIEHYEAMGLLVIRLLMLNKGDLELHPNMGVGLIANYRFIFIDDLDKLETEIEEQITTYITGNSIRVQVDIEAVESMLYISVNLQDNLLLFNFNTENNTIKLSDL